MRNRVLLVEPEAGRRDALTQTLADASYFVIPSPSPERALDRVWKASPDLVIVSPQATGMTAVQFVTFLRGDVRLKHMPVILMSAPLPSQDVVSYFRAGIDEYIDTNVPAEEMLARIRALLRRVYARDDPEPVFDFDGLMLQTDEHRVLVAGQPVTLTRKEFALLKTLMGRPNKVISSASLLSSIWGYDRDVSSKTLQVHINRLRRKLGEKAFRIVNFPGVGYTFSTETKANIKKERLV